MGMTSVCGGISESTDCGRPFEAVLSVAMRGPFKNGNLAVYHRSHRRATSALIGRIALPPACEARILWFMIVLRLCAIAAVLAQSSCGPPASKGGFDSANPAAKMYAIE